jgi:hypothetical protein
MKKAGHDGTCLKSQLLGRWRQEDLKLTKLAKPWGSRRGEEGEEEIHRHLQTKMLEFLNKRTVQGMYCFGLKANDLR